MLRLPVRWSLPAALQMTAFACLLFFCACSALEHGYRTREVAGQTLAMETPAAEERLQDTSASDRPAVRGGLPAAPARLPSNSQGSATSPGQIANQLR